MIARTSGGAPLAETEHCAALPLHYLFDLIPVGGNR